MDNQTHPTYPQYYTKFLVTVLDGESIVKEHTYFGDTGTKWRQKLVDLPAVNDLKVSIHFFYNYFGISFSDIIRFF
jgi:hypothetical protein